ncbi:D-alanyl-D-alanine carboxypeptidase family protein [Trichocoleus sp. FACHB-262]|uniref:M15 family metallopeptidase n=1 Tax=Trichocoleus sp. FACHB-262 TaxID=2692869 RepID=UPI00168602BF|nr:M15 family metallopeptidase [Trichocoleus sp. FACHB-262]MBD2124075.1 D-alanyl-D-alanine carboxypeptidase family protein [Trichocoleus sp. FACHB-262]
MNNPDLPGKPPQAPASLGDIPEAVRETPEIQPQPKLPRQWLMGAAGGLGAIALLSSVWLVSQFQKPAPSSPGANATAPSPQTEPTVGPNGETLLGHLPYPEAPAAELEPLTIDGNIKLRKAAAAAFESMVAAAQADGVALVPISGFRSLADQQHVFFDIKAERGQDATKRAEVSAPPGYSEHHTGYAIDVGDANAPETNLSTSFEETTAFQWLKNNAVRYNFEISFTKNNPQNVSYEPWHWRFVGDRASLETFYKAKNLAPAPSNTNSPQ